MYFVMSVHIKEPHVVEILVVLHYIISHKRIMVLGPKTLEIIGLWPMNSNKKLSKILLSINIFQFCEK